MGIHEDGALLHQRGHTHRITGIFHKHQESAAIRNETAVQGNAIHDGRHTELTYPVVQVVALRSFSADIQGGGVTGQVGRRQIRGTAEQLWQNLRIFVQCFLTGLTGRNVGWISLQVCDIGIGFDCPIRS